MKIIFPNVYIIAVGLDSSEPQYCRVTMVGDSDFKIIKVYRTISLFVIQLSKFSSSFRYYLSILQLHGMFALRCLAGAMFISVEVFSPGFCIIYSQDHCLHDYHEIRSRLYSVHELLKQIHLRCASWSCCKDKYNLLLSPPILFLICRLMAFFLAWRTGW